MYVLIQDVAGMFLDPRLLSVAHRFSPWVVGDGTCIYSYEDLPFEQACQLTTFSVAYCLT